MKRTILLLITMAILVLFGYAFCAAPLAVAMPYSYYGAIALWSVFLWILEEIWWNFFKQKDKDNNETKN